MISVLYEFVYSLMRSAKREKALKYGIKCKTGYVSIQ